MNLLKNTTDIDNDVDDEIEKPDGPVKFNEWVNPPKVSELKLDYQDALTVHNTQAQKIREYLDNLNITGSAKPKVKKGSSQVQPKLIRKQAEWRYAALSEPYLSNDNIFNVAPVTWEDGKAAKQNQLVLNNQFNTKISKVAFVDELIRTLVDEGTAIVMVGWKLEQEITEVEKPTFEYIQDPNYGQIIQQLDEMQQASPSQYDTDVEEQDKQAHQISKQYGVAYRPNQIGSEVVKNTKTLANHPTIDVCNYKNVVIDPTCAGNINKANFVIFSFESSMSELKGTGKYQNLENIIPNNNSPLNTPDFESTSGASGFNFNDEPRKKLVVQEYWGYWDIDKTGIVKPIVAAWIGDTMVRLEENPYPDGKPPFVIFQYLPQRKANYGEPDGVLIEDNQRIAGAVTRGMIDTLAKSANGQRGTRKDMLDAANKKRFENGEDYEYNGNVDPRVGMHQHQFAELPQSAPFMLQLQNAEAEALTGVKSFSDGMSGNSLGTVAAGIRGALDAASKRELGILRRISAGMCEIARKFISMNAKFLEPEEVVRITNEEFVTVRRDDLPGNFDLKVGVATAEEDEKKAQELAMMLQTMGPNMDSDMSKMILADIARLRKMPELAHKIEQYQPQPDPAQQRMQELQMALLEAQIATEHAKAAQFGSAAQLHSVKAGTEVAKQDHMKSDTDLKNLDYVEQESGVKQERDLQKSSAQAESQAKLAVVQHHLDVKKEKDTASSK